MKTSEKSKKLDLKADAIDFLSKTERYSKLVEAPRKVEFKCLALLAAWEATAKADVEACQWLRCWRNECAAIHPHKPALTLADTSATPDCPRTPRLSSADEKKAHTRVREGLKRVMKATLAYYFPGEETDDTLFEDYSSSSILFHLIERSFGSIKKIAHPEAYEIFILTLIETFERSLPSSVEELRSRLEWRSEIGRRRLGGAAPTKTLSDLKTVQDRSGSPSQTSRSCQETALSQVLEGLHRVVNEMSRLLRT
jgi:hypothetical protein